MKTWTKRTIAVCLLLALFLTAIPCASAKQYTDVTRSALPDYFDAINYVTDNGIMNGVSTSSFSPNEMVTRAMFITTLYRYAGSPSSFAAVSFTDISSSHYAYNAVKWGVKYNIVTGTTTTTFSPDEQVTREQAMTFLWRYLRNYVGGTPYYYGSISGCGDYSSIYDYARTPMYWAVSNAIIFASGSSKLLYPKAGVYRKELALWITRYGCNVDGIRFGKDNFSFTNTASSFLSPENKRFLISSEHYSRLLRMAGDNEIANIDSQIGGQWGGVCYGMSLSAVLDKKGINAFNENFEKNCKTMYSIKKPSITNTQHNMVRDFQDTTVTVSKTESTINYHQLVRNIWSRMSFKEIWLNNGNTLAPFINDLRKYGIAVVSFSYGDTKPLPGHAIVVYGMPRGNTSGGYDIRFYDPNATAEKTLTISADLKSINIPHNGKTVSAAVICYYVDFYSFMALDVDGDYNLSAASEYNDAETVWLGLDSRGKYEITNANGEALRYNEYSYDGDMDVLKTHVMVNGYDPDIVYLCVPVSDYYNVSISENGNLLHTIWNSSDFSMITGTGIENITISRYNIQMTGKTSDYEVRYFKDNPDKRIVIIDGSVEESFEIAQSGQDDLLTIDCDAPYKCAIKKLLGDVLTEQTCNGGEAITVSATNAILKRVWEE